MQYKTDILNLGKDGIFIMIGIIGSGVIEILILILVLKSGWMIGMMQNVPFMDLVVNTVSGYWGTIQQTLPSTGSFFLSELLQALVYMIIFKIISDLSRQLFHIGKHAKASAFEIMFSPIMEFITRYFISAVLTAYILQLFEKYVLASFQTSTFVLGSVSAAVIIVFCIIAFFLFRLTIVNFFLCLLGYVIFPTVIQLIAIEFVIVFCYYLFNVPGIFEQAGSIVIIMFGISCCIGALIGADRVKDMVGGFFGIS